MIVFSCKENDTAEEVILQPVPKIKTVTFYENNVVQQINDYEYNSLGRCSKLTFINFSPDLMESRSKLGINTL